MEIQLNTPALLFPAITLLLLAYTNRFVVLSGLIRSLHDRYKATREALVFGQIQNLRRRVLLIKHMQACGILSMLFCVVCMFLTFLGFAWWSRWVFGLSLLLLGGSLALSLMEIWSSVGALNLQLSDLAEFGGSATARVAEEAESGVLEGRGG